MATCGIYAVLPAERAFLASRVIPVGATPIVDRTAGAGDVPSGAWVRVTTTATDVPGDGPVIAAEGPALPGRACWREATDVVDVPAGYVGLVLRGLGSGGASGSEDVRALIARVPAGVRVLVDWPHGPDEPLPNVEGVLLSDVLFGLVDPPPGLAARLERLRAEELRRVNGHTLVASPAADAVRRLVGGVAFADVAWGWFAEDDAFGHAWPGGAGLLHAASLRRSRRSLEGALAAYGTGGRVTVGAVEGPGPEAEPQEAPVHFDQHEPIAVVGLGCRLPGGADSPERLWERLLAGFDAIVEVPAQRWDPALFWDPDRSVPDKTYAKIGGFITDFSFNPRRFRIPPSAARLIDPLQQWTLEAAADALENAGYPSNRAFDRERVAVILGNSMGGEIGDDYYLRVMFPALRKALVEVPGFAALPDTARARILEAYEAGVKDPLPPITEDSMPGELSNVVAGRVANALNLGGPNFTTDAACAGSMAAIQAAIKGLQDGDFDMALTGGADRSMGVGTYTKFCKIGALSPDGSRPFDADANGFVMGEGVGILVLRRLSDALRDGDQVYGVLRAVGASSDGKGKGITAPNPEGQKRALRRAYESAGVDPVDVDLFECHGTSTVVGDKVEVEALTEIIGRGRRQTPARIGSVKSNIGHLKSAAGAASALKVCLALHKGVLPPSIHYRNPRKDLDLSGVPLQVQTKPEAWEGKGPRFAGISAFGFGGTNFHIVVEGFRPEMAQERRRPSFTRAPAPAAPPPAAAAPAPAAPAPVAAAPAPAVAVTPDVVIPAPRASTAIPVPEGIWALSADSPEDMVAKCKALKAGRVTPYEPDAPLRLAAAAEDIAERDQQLEKAINALQKGKGFDLLRQRGIHLEDVPCDGQLSFLFTGQGSQYVGMGLDLAERYPVVADTFREADEVMTPLLGRPLSDYIRRDPSLSEDEQFERLRATEISQPATLTVDVAILRLMAAFGARPDVVAGHSLGEYGAAVASGMMTFRDALVAVSARGREMAAVKIDDFGKMAGIATSVETVEELLAEVPGYVIAANKNCPTQTVIAGDSDAVEVAIEMFRSRGITVYPLPVSHAFHSRIVAPASEPLRRVLQGLDLREPQRRITTNVDSRYYPTGPGAREKAIDILAKQVASPVEWIAQIERMYADGARIFVECGPKRALAGFVVSILKHRPHRALYTNQPKRGGVLSFLDSLASLFALGFPVRPAAERAPDLFAEGGERRSTSGKLAARAAFDPTQAQEGDRGSPAIQREILKIVAAKTAYPVEALDLDFELEGDLGIDTVKLADIVATIRERLRLDDDPDFRMSEFRTLRSIIDYAGRRAGSTTPASLPDRRPAAEPAAAPAPTAGPVLPTDAASSFLAAVASKDLRGLDAPAFAQAMLPALQAFLQASWSAFQVSSPPSPAPMATPAAAPVRHADVSNVSDVSTRIDTRAPASPVSSAALDGFYAGKIVCSGAAMGLPGGQEVFEPDNVRRLLRGENRILAVPEDQQDRLVTKGLVRLVKNARTGEGEFSPVEGRDQVIRLAGRKTHFDLCADYGIDPALARSLDITTQLAFAAGIEALRDAGLPLVRTFRNTTTGKAVATGWALPPELRDTTGIVFACAFPGYDQLLTKLRQNGDDGEGRFDRRFLFQVLSMGHSQFAQLVGARGPNTQVNAACASTTQAVSVAEDWLRAGRAERVIVIGADDVTNDNLLEWIGAGFLAAGAATTEDKVENAALPFDRRRHGMILGMGAVSLVLERDDAVRARGMVPIAELLGTRISNSAFHGTRLDAEHISNEVRAFAERVTRAAGVDRDTFARKCVFLSHETYTPARGGSAAAEMASLPAAFGPAASRIVIANTKGFTGHPMGAGIEDALAVKSLQYQEVPPIANLKEPDPDLGELTLSKGGHYPVEFALRLAAGFGSQLALAAWRKVAVADTRVSQPAMYQAWLAKAGGAGRLAVEHRQLRWVAEEKAAERLPEATGEARAPAKTASAPTMAKAAAAVPVAAHVAAPAAAPVATGGGVSRAEVLDTLIGVIAAKTGYDRAEIDPSYELEADLGIDTVKQAEVFGEVRDRYGLERDDSFRLADYPTVEKLAGWLADKAGASGADTEPFAAAAPGSVVAPVTNVALAEDVAPSTALATAPATGGVSADEVLDALIGVIATKTGYDRAEIDPAYELEADLGIDTVKQAEIFGEVRDRYGLARDDSFRLADYPTVRKLAGWLAEKAGAAPVGAAAEPAPVTTGEETPPEVSDVPDVSSDVSDVSDASPTDVSDASDVSPAGVSTDVSPDAVLRTVLEVVAHRTGYDVAELDPAYELEADLGIDTVKQAEIFGEVRDRYGLARDDDFRLADYPTLEKLAGYLAARAALRTGSVPPPASAEPAAEPAAEAQPEAQPLGVPETQAETPPTLVPPPAPPPGRQGPLLDPSPTLVPTPDGLDFRDQLQRALAEEATEKNVSRFGASGSAPLPPSFRVRRPVWVSRAAGMSPSVRGKRIRVLGENPLARALRARVDALGGVSADEAEIVIDAGVPVIDAFHVAKALDTTRPAQWVCVSEAPLDMESARDAGARAGLAKALGREWAGCRARVIDLSIELDPDEAASAVLQEVCESDLPVEVFLGAELRRVAALSTLPTPPSGRLPGTPVVLLTGGTRGITARVARSFAHAGPCVLVLVGRTPPGVEPLDEEAQRVSIKASLAQQGGRVTPRRIEDALKPLRVAEEVRQNVEELRRLGAQVEVQTLDLADPQAVGELVAKVLAAYGRIDVAVHGAGVEESRLLAEKDAAAFHRVFDAKAEGGLMLAAMLPPESFFVSMGSIAGRLGNLGQVDYAAANEAMARVCLRRPRSLHVAWTAWGDVGMAVRGGMEALLTSRGVELLPADAGADLTRDLIAAGVTGEVMVAGRLGDFRLPALHPLLDAIELDGDAAVGRRSLSLESDPWIADHAIDGVPVLPGVIGLELMAATALAAVPTGHYVGVEDVRFEAPLKLHRDEPAEIEVRAVPDEDGSVHCTLASTRRTRAGREIRTEHFSARVQLEEMPLLPALRSAFFPEERLSARDIYRRFFHGARFQVLRGAEAVAVQGLLAEANVEHAPVGEGLLTDPLVLEAAFQAAGLHRMALAGMMGLPSAIDAVERVRPVIEGDTLQVYVQARADDVYDIDVDGSNGRVMRVRGFRLVDRGPLPPGDRIPEPEGGWPSVAVATSSEAARDLGDGEKALYGARGTERRRQDRLAGQLAANRAVGALAETFTVRRAESGEPVVLGSDVRVSLTHHAGEAIALAVRGARAGVDLEAIEPRHPAFAREWFAPEERAESLDDEGLTRAWAVKEAVLKALGTGLRLSPREVLVLSTSPGDVRVSLRGEVARRHAELGGARLRVRLARWRGRVVATALFAA